MTVKFGINTDGMIKISEGQYTESEFKFKNTKIDNKILTFDVEFLQFYIDGVSYTNSATEEDFNYFIENVASNILKKMLYDASSIVTWFVLTICIKGVIIIYNLNEQEYYEFYTIGKNYINIITKWWWLFSGGNATRKIRFFLNKWSSNSY